MPPPIKEIKTEVPGNFFNEENMKFLDALLDDFPDVVSGTEDFDSDASEKNESKVKPEPRSTPSPLSSSPDYKKSPEASATSNDEIKRKTEKKKVDKPEENQRRTRKSRSRSRSSSRRRRQSPRRSNTRDQPKYRSRSRDKYKSRSPLRAIKRERRSSSEERQKRKQLKRSPFREVRRKRINSRDRRRSRSNDRRRHNSRSRSKSRDRRRSRSNDRRRDSRSRRSRTPIKKIPFLEEVKKTLAAKGQYSVEIEEFERLQRLQLKSDNASQVNSISTSVSSPVTLPSLPVQQRPRAELPSGISVIPIQNLTHSVECRNEPSTSKQLHIAYPYENIPLPQPIKINAGVECKNEPSTSKQLHSAIPHENIILPQPFKVKAETPDVVSLPDGTTQKIKKEKVDPRYEAIEVMPKAIKVEHPPPATATEKTKVLRLCDDAVNVFEKSDMAKESKSFLYTPTFVVTHSEEYADNRSPLNRINNVLFKFNSTNSNIDTKQWGIHMLSENTSKIVRFVGYDIVKLIGKLRNRDIPEQFKMDNKNHNEISDGKYHTPYFTDSSTQTDDHSCGECIARKLKKHVSEGVQAVPLQEDIGCQAMPEDELPLMRIIPTLNMSQQLATNDFVELLKGPIPTNSTEMYRLREKLLDIFNISQRPSIGGLNTSGYNQTIAPIVNSPANVFPPLMPMQHQQQQLQAQYQNALPVMLHQLGNNNNNVLAGLHQQQQQQQALLQLQQQQQQQQLQLQGNSNPQLMFQQQPNLSYANANRIVPPAPTMNNVSNRQVIDPRMNNVDIFRNRSPPIMNNEQKRPESRKVIFGRGGGMQNPSRNPRPF